MKVTILGALLGLSLAGCSRKAPPADTAPVVSTDGWTQPAGVGDPLVVSAGPLSNGAFFIAGATEAGEAWLLRVDASGAVRDLRFERGYFADVVAQAGDRLAVAGYRDDPRAFVAHVDAAGKVIDVEDFKADRGSEIMAATADGARVFAVGTENTPLKSPGANGWILGGGGARWDQQIDRPGYVYLTGVAVVGGALFAAGAAGSSDTRYRPLRVTRLLDGGIPEGGGISMVDSDGSYDALARLDDGVALVGTTKTADLPKLVVELYGPDLARRLAVRAGDPKKAAEPTVGRAIPIADGIAFTIATGRLETSDGAIVLVTKDGRSSTTPIPGRGMLTMRHVANWLLDVRGRDATFLRLRSVPAFGYRVEHLTLAEPANAPDLVDPPGHGMGTGWGSQRDAGPGSASSSPAASSSARPAASTRPTGTRPKD